MIRDYVDVQPSSTDKAGIKRFFDDFVFPFVGSMAIVQPENFDDYDYESALETLGDMLPIKK